MTNYVLFKDDHEEPILRYDEKPGRVEVDTPSGRYLYCEYVVTYPTGWHHKHYQFYCYRGFVDCQTADWIAVDDIKEFRFVKENRPC